MSRAWRLGVGTIFAAFVVSVAGCGEHKSLEDSLKTNADEEFIKNDTGNGRLKAERTLLANALTDVQGMAAALTGYLMAAQEDAPSVYKVGTGSVRFLMAVGDLLIGWLLARQAAVAIEKLDAGATGADKLFYEGKIAAASFFAKNMLPQLSATRTIIENLDNDLMELDEAAF